MSAIDLLRASTIVSAMAVIHASVQTLAALSHYDAGGPFDLTVGPGSRRLQRLLARLSVPMTSRVVAAAAVIRIAAALLLCLPGLRPVWYAAAAAIAVVLSVVLTMLSARYLTWAEQMTKVILGAAALAFLAGTEQSATFALWFIAGQVSLVYVSGGVLKLLTPTWRRGEALWMLLIKDVGGHRRLGTWLRTHPTACLLLSWGTIIWEIAFPLVLIVPPSIAYGVLGAGVLFHVVCAYAMGLSVYAGPFVAAYPAVLFANAQSRAWLAAGG